MATPKRKTTNKRARTHTTKRGTGMRELLMNAAGAFFARRSGSGRLREMDERGRSLSADRRRKAKTSTKPGRGDRGDRRR